MIKVLYWDIDGNWDSKDDLLAIEFDSMVDYWEWLTYSSGIKLFEVNGLR